MPEVSRPALPASERKAIGGLIAVVAEFRQFVGAQHGFGFHQHRGPDLGQAVFGGVDGQHELTQRAVDGGDGTGQEHEARAADLGGGFEIKALGGARNVEVFARGEIEGARCTVAVDLDVVSFVLAVRHIGVGQVG